MNLTINKFNEDIAFVPVPKFNKTQITYLKQRDTTIVDVQDTIDKVGSLKSLPGNWQILFRLSEAKEEDAKKIVEYRNGGYRNYDLAKGAREYTHAIAAMWSLIRENNLWPSPNQDIIVIEKVK